MPKPVVILELDGAVARIILNRPAARNALNLSLCREFQRLLKEVCLLVACNKIRAATLEGAGPAFCAGADLKERSKMNPAAMAVHSQLIAACCDRLAHLPCPVVACVNGAALGGGFELALACDLRVIASDATLGFPELTYGFFPGAGGPVRLARLVGISTATYLLMSTVRIDGEEAARLHISNESAPPGEANCRGLELATRIASLPVKGVSALRELLAGLDEDGVARNLARARIMRDKLNDDKSVRNALSAFRTN
jgi:methylglutaconyl-CoA hydratase